MTFLHRDLMPYAPRLFENKIQLMQFLKFFWHYFSDVIPFLNISLVGNAGTWNTEDFVCKVLEEL